MSSERSANRARLVIGLSPALDLACNAWRRACPELEVRSIVVAQGLDYVFDEASFADYGSPEVPAFVAIDQRFLGFKRLELMRLLAARGFRFDHIVGLHAIIGEGATLGANAFIGEGAIIGDGAAIGEGAWIGPRAVIGPHAVIEAGAWIDAGVVIGARSKLGAQTQIASGVVIADGAEIGELCVLAVPGVIRGEVRDRTYVQPGFDEPIRILG